MRTMYLLETTYLDEGVPLETVLRVACRALAPWAVRYEARLIMPHVSDTPTLRRGTLPTAVDERRAALDTLLTWLTTNTAVEDLFALSLWEADQTRPFFQYPDTPDVWSLWLTPAQWHALQTACQSAHLPTDLFFDADQVICVPVEGNTLLARLARRLGFQKCYTPRQWKRRQT